MRDTCYILIIDGHLGDRVVWHMVWSSALKLVTDMAMQDKACHNANIVVCDDPYATAAAPATIDHALV